MQDILIIRGIILYVKIKFMCEKSLIKKFGSRDINFACIMYKHEITNFTAYDTVKTMRLFSGTQPVVRLLPGSRDESY